MTKDRIKEELEDLFRTNDQYNTSATKVEAMRDNIKLEELKTLLEYKLYDKDYE